LGPSCDGKYPTVHTGSSLSSTSVPKPAVRIIAERPRGPLPMSRRAVIRTSQCPAERDGVCRRAAWPI
jgi:hypothetical protein